MNPDFTRYQKLPNPDTLLVSSNLIEIGTRTESRPNVGARPSLFPLPRSAAVPAASSGGVSPLEEARGETPREPAGEDARVTLIRA